MMFFRPPLAHILSKHLEGALYVSVYDDSPSNEEADWISKGPKGQSLRKSRNFNFHFRTILI
jgi:hypothetical protein